MWLNFCDGAGDMLERLVKAIAPGRCRQQRLGGYAAGIEAFAAHARALDQYHRRAHLRRSGCNREAARTGADHTDIAMKGLSHPSLPRSRQLP